jgi:hypothetical protein
MPDRVIENPFLNSPFREPTRHFRSDDDGKPRRVAETVGSEYGTATPQQVKEGDEVLKVYQVRSST